MKTILVTGAEGYIGPIHVRKLLEKGIPLWHWIAYKLPEHNHLRIIQEDSRCKNQKCFKIMRWRGCIRSLKRWRCMVGY